MVNAEDEGNPYLHDRRANKTCTTRKRLQNHTTRNPSLKLFVCVLVLVAAPFAWWTMMAELCFSVDDFILDFFSNTAADTASEYESYGHRRAGQQRPRAPATPAGTTPSR